MSETIYKNRNDFTCVAYQGSRKTAYMKYVNKLTDFVSWMEKEKKEWSVINVYARRSGDFIVRYYRDDIIPKRPLNC
ncbi:MAG: hypothetical protein RLO17_23635 [Cyclobacteriaceae bacterium]